MSSPAIRMKPFCCMSEGNVMLSSQTITCSMGTTASQPAGMGAPVIILIAEPNSSIISGLSPA